MTPTVSIVDLDGCAKATGTVVVIDVIRAFTTAAVALAAGAREIVLVGSVEEALALRERMPGSYVMGEVGGLPPPGFDLGNSPAQLAEADVRGRILIHRTSAGTQGVVRAVRATRLLTASFVCAAATLRQLRAWDPEHVTFVATGHVVGGRDGDEDVACADYLAACLQAGSVSAEPYLKRVRQSVAAAPFLHADQPAYDPRDIDFCCDCDRYDFAMQVHRENGLACLRLDGSP